MGIVQKLRETGTACLISVLCAACANPHPPPGAKQNSHPPPGAKLYAREYFGTAQGRNVTDRVEFFGVGFTPNNPVALRAERLPGHTQDAVFSIPGTPQADQYGFLDFVYEPPCIFSVGDLPTVERPIVVLATDAAGWTVSSDSLTARSFACDSPPPNAAQNAAPVK
jgi:hypothetical protein